MNVMIIGGGGREHALLKSIARNPQAKKLYALPGGGGISSLAECVNISATDIDSQVKFALEHKIDFAVVAPDDPLALGAVDKLEEAGVKCFGPTQKAARIESSKIFAKELMTKYGIPTAKYEIFTDIDKALTYCATNTCPLVVKADGLAKGKGVTVCANFKQAREAVISCMKAKTFGEAGERILIEECLTGPEVTVLALTDGHTITPLMSSMDHKRAYDGNTGPNTGGMGVIAPNPYYTPEIAEYCMKNIFLPTIDAMNKEGCAFKGCLYFGLMLTKDGPKVIEYNSRFGDPETEAILPLLDGDMLSLMLAVREERLAEANVKFKAGASCCVVLASGGYPGICLTGYPIDFGGAEGRGGVEVYHCGTKFTGTQYVTNGGRVLAVTGIGATPEEARQRAYESVRLVKFEGMRYRTDIGAKPE